jgi:hypothetical protein
MQGDGGSFIWQIVRKVDLETHGGYGEIDPGPGHWEHWVEKLPLSRHAVLYICRRRGMELWGRSRIFRTTVTFYFFNPSHGPLYPVPCNWTDCSFYTLQAWRLKRNLTPKLRYSPIKTTVSQPRRPVLNTAFKIFWAYRVSFGDVPVLWFFAPCGCCWCCRRFGGKCLDHFSVAVPVGLG